MSQQPTAPTGIPLPHPLVVRTVALDALAEQPLRRRPARPAPLDRHAARVGAPRRRARRLGRDAAGRGRPGRTGSPTPSGRGSGCSRTRSCATRCRCPGPDPSRSARSPSTTTRPSGGVVVVPSVVVGRRVGQDLADDDHQRRTARAVPAAERRHDAAHRPDRPRRRRLRGRRLRRLDGRRLARDRGRAGGRRGEGRARPRRARPHRAPGGRALGARAAGRRLRVLLDVQRRRAGRRDAGAPGALREGTGDLARAGGHDPPHRRRPRRPGARRDPRALLEGPRGARVRRAVGRRGARSVLLVDERPGRAVRAPPAQRAAPRLGRHGRAGLDRRRRTRRRSRSRRRCTRPPPSAARRPSRRAS